MHNTNTNTNNNSNTSMSTPPQGQQQQQEHEILHDDPAIVSAATMDSMNDFIRNKRRGDDDETSERPAQRRRTPEFEELVLESINRQMDRLIASIDKWTRRHIEAADRRARDAEAAANQRHEEYIRTLRELFGPLSNAGNQIRGSASSTEEKRVEENEKQ